MGDVKTGNLLVQESEFILYEIVIYGALMPDLTEWIRYHMLQVSPDEVKYSIIFAHSHFKTLIFLPFNHFIEHFDVWTGTLSCP